MLCEFTKHLAALPPEQFFREAQIIDCVDLETPQTVFVIACKVCQCTHSVELDSPANWQQLAKSPGRYKQVA